MEVGIKITLFLLAGILVGLFYFAGLWWTVSQVARRSRYKKSVLFLSFLLRTTVVLVGFYLLLVNKTNWVVLVAALLGFLLARIAVTSYVTRDSRSSVSR